jgi:hypothetical protein
MGRLRAENLHGQNTTGVSLAAFFFIDRYCCAWNVRAGRERVFSSPREIYTKATGLDGPLEPRCDRLMEKGPNHVPPPQHRKRCSPILFDSLHPGSFVVLIESTKKAVNKDRQLRRIHFFTDLFCNGTPLLICRFRGHKRGLHFCHEPSYLGVKAVTEQ